MSVQSTELISTNKLQSMWTSQRKTLYADLIAGATGAVAGAPQAMGFALIAGISPVYGLYTAIVATIVGAFTANSTYMTIGPTNAVALLVGSTLIQFDQASQIERLFLLTFLVGAFQVAFGFLQLGDVTHYFSRAVMTGFITGAGLLIISGQLAHITGYELHKSGVLPKFWEWLTRLGETDIQTMIVGVMTMAMIVFAHHTRWKNIGILIALIVSTVFVLVLNWTGVEVVKDISGIPSQLPNPVSLNFTYTQELLPPALALAILALVQSAALTQSIPEPKEHGANVNRDFIGQGVSNIAAGFFQGMPSGGSLSRTAVNISSGAKTPMANIFAGVLIALTVVLLGSAIEQITLAALAGHLVVAAFSLLNMDAIKTVWRVSMSGRLSMSVTFISTLVLPLEYSIYIGVILSLAMYIHTSTQNLMVVRLVPLEDGHYREENLPAKLPDDETVIIGVYGNLYFAAVRRLEQLLPSPNGSHNPVVILRLRNNQYLGSTGLRFLKNYAEKLDTVGGTLLLAGVSPEVKGQLERTHGLEDLGQDHVFFSNHIVFSATERALAYAESLEHDESTA